MTQQFVCEDLILLALQDGRQKEQRTVNDELYLCPHARGPRANVVDRDLGNVTLQLLDLQRVVN